MKTSVTASAIEIYKENIAKIYDEYSALIRNLPISERCDYEDEKRILGEGSYGTVKLARTSDGSKHVVVKTFRYPVHKNGISTLREICLLSKLDHENVLKLLDICCEGVPSGENLYPKLTIITELCRCDLYQMIYAIGGYDKTHCKSIIQQILRGLSYIHGQGVLHRDLKPANVLIGRDGKIKIADFGFARLKRKEACIPYSPLVSTFGYRAPELMLSSEKYDESVDIFAAGIIFVELFIGDDLFPGTDEKKVAEEMTQLFGKINNEKIPGIEKLSGYEELFAGIEEKRPNLKKYLEDRSVPSEAIIFAATLLQVNPEHRPSATRALNNSYFTTDPQPNENILELIPPKYGIA